MAHQCPECQEYCDCEAGYTDDCTHCEGGEEFEQSLEDDGFDLDEDLGLDDSDDFDCPDEEEA